MGAAADGAFVNYGLGAPHVSRVRELIAEGAAGAPRERDRRPGPSPTSTRPIGVTTPSRSSRTSWASSPRTSSGRTPPGAACRAISYLRSTSCGPPTPRARATWIRPSPGDLGLFDYLLGRLAIAGTPEDCIAPVRAAEAAGVTRLMFAVSLAADPERTVERFGRAVLPRFARG